MSVWVERNEPVSQTLDGGGQDLLRLFGIDASSFKVHQTQTFFLETFAPSNVSDHSGDFSGIPGDVPVRCLTVDRDPNGCASRIHQPELQVEIASRDADSKGVLNMPHISCVEQEEHFGNGCRDRDKS